MKFIISFVAVTALSLVTSVFAQEESPAASPSEEKASATVEEKPAATSSPEESKPAKKEEAAAKKESSPAAKKETSPASTATKSASPAAASSPAKKLSTEAALREMENKWEAAVATHDANAVQPMVAPDYVGVSSKFKFTGRSGLLSDFKNDKDKYTSAKNEALKVATFGPNVAVVTGRAREKGTAKDGKSFDRVFFFTDTWMLRNGQWQCIASQAAEAKK